MLALAFGSLWLFAALAAVDGLVLHLWRFRLYAFSDSRREHALHTLRAVLFVPILILLFARDSLGFALWTGVAIALVDTGIELWDTFIEPASRRALGGLTAFESTLHAALVTLRSAAIALILASKPAGAWTFATPSAVGPGYGAWGTSVVQALLGGAIAIALLHVWLAVRGTSRVPNAI